MQSSTYLLSIGLATMLLANGPAIGQPTPRSCGARDAVIDRLAQTYGESRQSIGLGADNQVVELFASHETGTWTITVTLPNGMMCLVASGHAYEAMADAVPAPGQDA